MRVDAGWSDFGWQGVRARVPEEWNLGRVDGGPDTGYVRLDDAEIVRAEIEWRTARRGTALPLSALVDRYLAGLQQRASKGGLEFAVERPAHFLGDASWLAGREHDVFAWRADYEAYNLVVRTRPERIVLIRVLGRIGEAVLPVVRAVMASLRDDSQAEEWLWSVYGLTFAMPAAFRLDSHELRSGHIKLTFARGRQTCRVERLSMAQTLLRGQALAAWYPVFFRRQLRDMVIDIAPQAVRGDEGLRVTGRPRSRWRQLLRPLPWIDPRQRVHMDGLVWHCAATNKICIVDHQFRRPDERGDLTERVAHGYLCHQEAAEAEPRGHAELAAGAEPGSRVGAHRAG